MVVGLLLLTSIPTVTGISLGISERSKPETLALERARMRKFTLTCWCAGRSSHKSFVHGSDIVLGDGKMWIQSRKTTPSQAFYPFNGFYLDYPDEERTPPPPTGLVTLVSDSPPLMNWIYVDKQNWEVRHGNRTVSRPHEVGDFGWTSEGEEDMSTEPGGLTLSGEERFVAVEPRKGSMEEREGRWEVFWDEKDDKLAGVKEVQGRTVLRVSLERAFLEEEIAPKEGEKAEAGSGHATNAKKTQQQVTRRIINGKEPQPGGGNAVVNNVTKAENVFTYEPMHRQTRGYERRHYETDYTWHSRQKRLNLKTNFVVYDELSR